MRLVAARDFERTLRDGGLTMADPKAGIGRELHYSGGPARTVVVQFSDKDPIGFRSGVAKRILDIADVWLLFPRHGALPSFGLVELNEDSIAIEFGPEERGSLAEYLATRPMGFDKHGLDLYAIAKDGQALLIWDHHTEDEGLSVDLQHVRDAVAVVASLCGFGTELEMYSKTWGEGGADV